MKRVKDHAMEHKRNLKKEANQNVREYLEQQERLQLLMSRPDLQGGLYSEEFDPWQLAWLLTQFGFKFSEPYIDEYGSGILGAGNYYYGKGMLGSDLDLVLSLPNLPSNLKALALAMKADPKGATQEMYHQLAQGLAQWGDLCTSGESGFYECMGEASPVFAGVGLTKAGITALKVAGKISSIEKIASLLKVEPNKAFFWSGKTDGIGGQANALNIAEQNGGVTLEKLIDSNDIDIPEWNINDPSSIKAWEDISKTYASQASGEVTAVIGQDLRSGNLWETVELPTLLSNPNVTKITVIDPATLEETVIFKK